MVPRSLLLVSTMISALALAACGGDEQYYIPAESELKPFQKPEREELVAGEEEDSWEDLDFDEAAAEEEEAEEEEETPAEGAAEEDGPSSEGPKKAPEIKVGKATAKGALDKNIIRRYIRRQLPRFRLCYEKRLLKKPELEGTVKASFVIGPDGKVTESKASGFPDQKVSECVSAAVREIVFPKPKGGGNVVVNYPFTFKSG